jgi:hypothetical protein
MLTGVLLRDGDVGFPRSLTRRHRKNPSEAARLARP